MKPVTLDISMLPLSANAWGRLYWGKRVALKKVAELHILVALRKARVEKIETPCVVNAHIYFGGRSNGGGLDFANLALGIDKMMIDPLVKMKVLEGDTVDHISNIQITRHPKSDRNHTVLTFEDEGARYRELEGIRKAKMQERTDARKRHALTKARQSKRRQSNARLPETL